jgi:hypothetical protein
VTSRGIASLLGAARNRAPAAAAANARRAEAWLWNAFGRPDVVELTPETMARRRSDTIYIFGSGYSVNALSPAQLRKIEEHDTMGFSLFVLHTALRIDYHLFRELGFTSHDKGKARDIWRQVYAGCADILRRNPAYRHTVYLIQGGWPAIAGNRLVGRGYLPPGARVMRYRNGLRGDHPPAASFADGVTHGPSTVTDCVNLAALLGWKRIVLAGIDLYDRRYFWQARDRGHLSLPGITDTGGGEYAGELDNDLLHRTALPMKRWARDWREALLARGISLEIANPKSLIAGLLPVHAFE